MLKWVLLFSMATSSFAAELPAAPAPQSKEETVLDAQSASALYRDEDGKIKLARWTVGLYLEHDKNGFGPSSRLDYRVSNRWGLVATEVKKTVSGGVTIRLGSLK